MLFFSFLELKRWKQSMEVFFCAFHEKSNSICLFITTWAQINNCIFWVNFSFKWTLIHLFKNATDLRLSLDPNSQKMVGYLRSQLSQFNRLYKSGSLTDSNVPGILKISLDLWVIFNLNHFQVQLPIINLLRNWNIMIWVSWIQFSH